MLVRDHNAMRRSTRLTAALLLAGSVATGPLLAADDPGAQQALRLWEQLDAKKLALRSKSALIVDHFGNPLYERASDEPVPVASITKLMTAMVVLDRKLPLDEKIEITKTDRDLVRLTGSRLKYGAQLTRHELLLLALMSSENRAAAALARTYPGGKEAFVKAMNLKARMLGMYNSRFTDPAGLEAGNVATARDLSRLVFAAMRYPIIKQASTQKSMQVRPYKGRGPLRYVNTNRLLRNENWNIQVSKTGYINEAGRCLVMHTEFEGTPTVVVLLNSYGKLTPFGDANRVRKWIEKGVSADDRRTATADSEPPSAG
jgi:D-alanyl-D-alanine endopeptidase (penicillin-binding protein 7)